MITTAYGTLHANAQRRFNVFANGWPCTTCEGGECVAAREHAHNDAEAASVIRGRVHVFEFNNGQAVSEWLPANLRAPLDLRAFAQADPLLLHPHTKLRDGQQDLSLRAGERSLPLDAWNAEGARVHHVVAPLAISGDYVTGALLGEFASDVQLYAAARRWVHAVLGEREVLVDQ